MASGGVHTDLEGKTSINLQDLRGHYRFYQLVVKAMEVHSAKNQDYADTKVDPLSNFRACERFGISAYDGILTRLSDKNARIEQLRAKSRKGEGPAVPTESAIDTHLDAAVYNLLAIILLEEENEVVLRRSIQSQGKPAEDKGQDTCPCLFCQGSKSLAGRRATVR